MYIVGRGERIGKILQLVTMTLFFRSHQHFVMLKFGKKCVSLCYLMLSDGFQPYFILYYCDTVCHTTMS